MSTAGSIKEWPILFSGPMVRAILAGSKTQTRRVVKGINREGRWFDTGAGVWQFTDERTGDCKFTYCPHGAAGGRLWVRETFATDADTNIFYRADGGPDPWTPMQWKPSIFMPRRASRIALEITVVRIERLNDISNEDCVAEGITAIGKAVRLSNGSFAQAGRYEAKASTVRQLFSELWTDMNGPGSWSANPWVWVIQFKRLEGQRSA